MAIENPIDTIYEARPDLADQIDSETLRRVLTQPQQESLAEALAADAVDAAPILGDVLASERLDHAEEMGIDYPERPAFIENAISDLPPPVDTIGDILVAQNTISHLQEER